MIKKILAIGVSILLIIPMVSCSNEDGKTDKYTMKENKQVIVGISDMQDKSFTSDQIAKDIGVSRITARRYLDYLEKEQKLVVEMEYGNVGRPKNKYRIKGEY